MFCCGFLGTILIVFSALTSLAFLLAANIGTIDKQMVKSSIFLMELDMSELNTASIYSAAESYTVSQLGFADAYIFGMYGFCRGEVGTTETVDKIWENVNFKDSTCTSSSITYTFDPISFVVNQINEYNSLGINVTESDIALPGGLADYVKTASHLSQVIYICSIIACCLTVLTVLFQLLCWCWGGGMLTSFVQFLAFVAAIISSGCATGAYKYIETEFNKNAGDFGIHAQLSKNFLILTWLGTGISFLTIFIIFFVRCCAAIPSAPAAAPAKYDRVL